jgi:hypothetical protein
MNIDPFLLKAFRLALLYGIGAFLYFYFFGSNDAETLSQKGIKAAATAGIFMLLYYVVGRVLRNKNEADGS